MYVGHYGVFWGYFDHMGVLGGYFAVSEIILVIF